MDEELKGTEYLSLDVGCSKSGGRVNNGRSHRLVLVRGARRRISPSSSLSRGLFFQRPRSTGGEETKPEAERTTVSFRCDSSVGKVT